jgi:hypothetical protein
MKGAVTFLQEVLSAGRWLTAFSPTGSISTHEVVTERREGGTPCPDSMIWTHAVTAVSINAPVNRSAEYSDIGTMRGRPLPTTAMHRAAKPECRPDPARWSREGRNERLAAGTCFRSRSEPSGQCARGPRSHQRPLELDAGRPAVLRLDRIS